MSSLRKKKTHPDSVDDHDNNTGDADDGSDYEDSSDSMISCWSEHSLDNTHHPVSPALTALPALPFKPPPLVRVNSTAYSKPLILSPRTAAADEAEATKPTAAVSRGGSAVSLVAPPQRLQSHHHAHIEGVVAALANDGAEAEPKKRHHHHKKKKSDRDEARPQNEYMMELSKLDSMRAPLPVYDCVADLPQFVRDKMALAGVSDAEAEANWGVFLCIVEFLTARRCRNAWKEAKVLRWGDPGPDYLGEVDDLVRTDVPNPHALYDLRELIGRGGFAVVNLARRKSDGDHVAIKRMKHTTAFDRNANFREIGLMRQACLTQDNIVRFHEALVDYETDEIWIVVEALEGGNLQAVCDITGGIEEPFSAFIAKSLLKALNYLHGAVRIVHRDVKSANVLFTLEGDVVLIDFGLARDVRHAPGVSLLGSPLYMPPEMLAYEPHSFPADIWSFGMLLTEMALGRPMLVGSAMRAMLDTATRAIDLSKLEGHCSERMLSMVRDSLVFDQALRPTSLDLRRHPWLKESASQAEFAKYLGRVYRRDWWGRVKSTLCCGAAPNQNQQQSNQKK
jgi:hypothetical protein